MFPPFCLTTTAKFFTIECALCAIPPMIRQDYYVRGCTALLDAIGKAIHHISNVHKYARKEDRPEKTLFLITTDVTENASREYTYNRLKAMIQHQKEKDSWEFLFLGTNIDAAKEADRFGIGADCAANYHADRQGTAIIYEAIADAVCNIRACRPKSAQRKDRIDEDYRTRNK